MKEMKKGILLVLAGAILINAGCASFGSGRYRVESAEELSLALEKAGAGDTVILENGIYRNQLLVIDKSGTQENPLTIRAETAGGVVLTGNSRLRIGGDHVIVDGLFFKDGVLGTQDGGVIEFRRSVPGSETFVYASHSRLTNTVVAYYNNPDRKIDYKWISLYGAYNRVDHCEVIGKNHSGTAMVVWRDDDSPQYHEIVGNKFLYIEDDEDGNGAEALRIGTSHHSLSDSFTLVEGNYFEQCNGEIEIISNKSGGNIYRANVFVDNEGMLTLRHGNNCTVENNCFLGGDYYGTGGIRIIGEDHRITGNYIENTRGDGGKFRSAICLTNALDGSPLNGYYQVKNAYIAHNILVGNARNFIIGGGADSNLVLPPLDCTIESNLIYMVQADEDPFYYYVQGENLMLRGNEVKDLSLSPERPVLSVTRESSGAPWSGSDEYSDDPSFRERNLFEEAFVKQVVLPWSDLVKWSGKNGIIIMGPDSADVYVDSLRLKYDIRDDSVVSFIDEGGFRIPRDFIESLLGRPADGAVAKDTVTLEEMGKIYGYHVTLFDGRVALAVKEEEYFELLTIKNTLKKMADLYRVVGSGDDGNKPPNVLDGLLSTRWSADGDGQWVRIDMGDPKTVTRAEAAFYKGDERRTRFDLQISPDGKEWTTLYKGESSGADAGMESFSFAPGTGRYFRFVGHMNSSNTWNSISEIQLYEDDKALLDYVSLKADVYVEKTMEPVADIQLEGTPILPLDDAYVEIGSPDTAFGMADGDKLRIKAKLDNSIVRISYLKFDVSQAGEIASAQFQISGKVSTNNPANPRFEFFVFGLENDGWEEETLTWNNSPNHDPESTAVTGLGETALELGSFVMYGAGQTRKHVVDVTEFVKTQQAKDGVVTLMLADTLIQNGNSDPYSKERSNEDHRPKLYIQ